jgi:hypothetical protein
LKIEFAARKKKNQKSEKQLFKISKFKFLAPRLTNMMQSCFDRDSSFHVDLIIAMLATTKKSWQDHDDASSTSNKTTESREHRVHLTSSPPSLSNFFSCQTTREFT